MNDNDFDKMFSDKLNEERNFPYSEKNWDAVSAKLSAAQNLKMWRTILFRAAMGTLLAGILLSQWTAINKLKTEISDLKTHGTTVIKYDTILKTTVIYKTDTLLNSTKLEQLNLQKNKNSFANIEQEETGKKLQQKINSQNISDGKVFQKNISQEKNISENISKNILEKISEKDFQKNISDGKNISKIISDKNISEIKSEKNFSDTHNATDKEVVKISEPVLGINNSIDAGEKNIALTETEKENKLSLLVTPLSSISASPLTLKQRQINLPDEGVTLKQFSAIKITHQRVFNNFSLDLRLGLDILFDKHNPRTPVPGQPPMKDPNTMFTSNMSYGVQLERSFGVHWRAFVSADYSQLKFTTEAENPRLYVPTPQPIKDYDFHHAHADMSGWFLGVGTQYSIFTRSAVQPFVSLGYAYQIVNPFQIEYEYHGKAITDTQTKSITSLQHAENWYNIGLGVDVRIYKNISARVKAEYRNTFGGSIDKNLLHLQGGVVLGF